MTIQIERKRHIQTLIYKFDLYIKGSIMQNININNTTIFITGAAGFIGSNLCKRLLNDHNVKVIGIDNMNDYYDVKIKEHRLNELFQYDNFIFIKDDISKNKGIITQIPSSNKVEKER